MKRFISKYKGLIILLLILIIMTPAAYYIAERFEFGDAWGEWELEVVKEMTGVAPEGMKKLENLYKWAPLPDYSSGGLLWGPIEYLVSAIIGVLLSFAVFYLIYRIDSINAKK